MISTTEILTKAREVIRRECEALGALEGALDEGFVQAVELLYRCAGRVIVTGVGKSALVGQKFAATLNSMGTPSVFLHAADAVHGDLGVITGGDVLVFFSKSGTSPEITVLHQIIAAMGNPYVAVVSNRRSSLARKAQAVIYIPIEREAEPNNLAPTASTTAQMAVGDALAVVLSQLRGFTAVDFARFHPGGTLGKYYHLKAEDFAAQHEAPSVGPSASIREVIYEISSKRLGATAVMERNAVIGIITDGDLRRMLERHSDLDQLCARDIMTAPPKTIAHDAPAVEILQTLRRYKISQLIVLREGTYIGMVHFHDLIREGLT